MELTIPFEKGVKHTRNMIIAHAEHKTTYQVLVDITQLKYASCLIQRPYMISPIGIANDSYDSIL